MFLSSFVKGALALAVVRRVSRAIRRLDLLQEENERDGSAMPERRGSRERPRIEQQRREGGE